MTNIDSQLIHRKLETLQDYLQKLEELKGLGQETFLSDHKHYALAEHYLQLAIEIVLDVSRHLVVALGLETPEDAHGLLPALQKAGILSDEFVRQNLKMPGFRNRLLHAYEEIDHQKTYKYLQEHYQDLQEFSRLISIYLLKQTNG